MWMSRSSTPAVRRTRCSRSTRASTRRCCRSATCRSGARSSRPTFGARRSRGTTAGAWLTPCGACCRSGCCSLRRLPLCAPRASVSERALLLLFRDGDGALDYLHQAAWRALRRAVAGPDRRRLLLDDVGEVAAALDARRREGGDVERARPLVAVLDQQPAPAIAPRRPN